MNKHERERETDQTKEREKTKKRMRDMSKIMGRNIIDRPRHATQIVWSL